MWNYFYALYIWLWDWDGGFSRLCISGVAEDVPSMDMFSQRHGLEASGSEELREACAGWHDSL